MSSDASKSEIKTQIHCDSVRALLSDFQRATTILINKNRMSGQLFTRANAATVKNKELRQVIHLFAYVVYSAHIYHNKRQK